MRRTAGDHCKNCGQPIKWSNVLDRYVHTITELLLCSTDVAEPKWRL